MTDKKAYQKEWTKQTGKKVKKVKVPKLKKNK